MDALTSRHIGAGDGTPETAWRPWLAAHALPRCMPEQLVRAGQRAVVVAPHPDDEVLSVGGLLAQLATLGRPLAVLAVTDGEASHPGSARWPPHRLALRRMAESRAALAVLGTGIAMRRAGLRDGQVAAQGAALADWLARRLGPDDVVFTTWALDGHPDHEATGRATRAAAARCGARVYEVPVWGWHWASAGAATMPWAKALLVPLSPQAVKRKCAALQRFRSQWERDPHCPGTPVLPATQLARARRPFEVVFA